MKWSGLLSNIQRASAFSVVLGVVAAFGSLGLPMNSVVAAEPPEASVVSKA